MEAVDLGAETARLRRQFADQITALDEAAWNAASWCRGWRDRRFHLVGTSEAMGLVDVLVHTADALRPLGIEVDTPPADAAPALDALWKSGRMIVHATPQQGRRLIATDLDWSRGSGPEVRGKGIDLLLLVANRRQVLADLAGPGVAGL